MAGRNSDDDKEEPWHNRTPEVIGASLIAIVVIGILIAAATAVARQFGEPEQAPIDYIAPTYSATASESATTGTITSTSPPETTDIDAPSGSSSSSSSSSSTTSSSSETSTEPTTAATEDEEDDEPTSTTRQRPRTNVTRTFNPFP